MGPRTTAGTKKTVAGPGCSGERMPTDTTPATEDISWLPMSRRPAAYELIICLGDDGVEYAGLTYSKYEGRIIEPITGKAAEPVIGPMQGWKYQER